MPKTASELSNTDVFHFYNNPELSNAQVVEALDTTWADLKTKVRVNKTLASSLTMVREGGTDGAYFPLMNAQVATIEDAEIVEVMTDEAEANVTTIIMERPADNLPSISTEFHCTLLIQTNSGDQRREIPGPTRQDAERQIKDAIAEIKIAQYTVQDEAGDYVTSINNIRTGQTIKLRSVDAAA